MAATSGGLRRWVGWLAFVRLSALILTASLWLDTAKALEISVANVQIPAGQAVSVPIRASGAKGVSALQMRLMFEGEAFEVVDVSSGPILANALVDFKPTKGFCTIAFAASEPVAEDGDLLIVKIRRKPGSDAGSIVLPQNARAWAGEGGQSVHVSVKPGQIAEISRFSSMLSHLDWRYFVGGVSALAVLAAGVAALLLRRRRASAIEAPSSLRQPAPSGPGPHFCIACGASLAQGSKFCPNCGVPIADSQNGSQAVHPP